MLIDCVSLPAMPLAVAGNWKCNPESPDKLDGLIANINSCDTSKCEVYVCPSPLHVAYCQGKFTNDAVVAPQNCNFTGCGAYTGEMAVDQMKAMGISWVLLGHSERRGEFGLPTPKESNALLATKLAYVLEKGLNCVFCIGEPLPIREKGADAVLAECINQLNDVKDLLDPARVVIAYEPVWAIGTGVTASPEQVRTGRTGDLTLGLAPDRDRALPRHPPPHLIRRLGSSHAPSQPPEPHDPIPPPSPARGTFS